VLRTAIEAHGGWLSKHTGDGVCAAFASPRSAVDAAVTAQRGPELPVRMALATGAAESGTAGPCLRIAQISGSQISVLEESRVGSGRTLRSFLA
jgi:class 3 adenylate cyclase